MRCRRVSCTPVHGRTTRHGSACLDKRLTPDILAAQACARRTYKPRLPICGLDFDWKAATRRMEGTLILLLSGVYLGFMHEHYAMAEVERG